MFHIILHQPEIPQNTGSIGRLCVNNGAKPGGRVIEVAKFQKLVKEQGVLIDGGYGKIKGTTFRISNMGDETDETIAAMLRSLDAALAETPVAAA